MLIIFVFTSPCFLFLFLDISRLLIILLIILKLYKNNWLIALLEHNAFSWETITMMRHKVRTQRRPLTSFFTRVDVNQYNDSCQQLVKIFRDATVATPGPH